jgi:D-alanyl-D-alanine carboxypeptidase (penicillin-binding protein 5/6)
MRRTLFSLILLFSSLSAKPLQVDVPARSAILMNADTGAILFEKQAHTPSFPASITKVATALFVLDQKQPPMDKRLTVSADALTMKPLKSQEPVPTHWWDHEGTRMWLLKGEVLSLDSLLHGLLLISANDAGNIIAENLSGSVPLFLDELNAYVRSIGCQNTQFRNPHGCHHPEHFTTAYDFCLIANRAFKNPKFREIVSKVSYDKPKTNKQGAKTLTQFNALIKPGKYFYPKAIGGKTGWHSQSLSTLVAAAEHEGRVLVTVILGSAKKQESYKSAIRLFEAAFAEKKETRRFFGPEQIFSRALDGAQKPLIASLSADLNLSFFPSEEPECKAYVQWGSHTLPIKKGQKVGELRLVNQKGELLQQGDLLAREELTGTFLHKLKGFFH